MMRRASWVLVALVVLSAAQTFAQADVVNETACDTVVEGHRFTICVKDSIGLIAGWGNRNERGERNGWWYYLKSNGAFDSIGRYRRDCKIGIWWVSVHEYVVYGRNEQIKTRQHGCRRCPVF